MNYQNIGYALFSTIKQTFLTGSSRLVILYKQVLNPIFVMIYFYSFIFLMYDILLFRSYIYLNIFLAIIIEKLSTPTSQKEEQI